MGQESIYINKNPNHNSLKKDNFKQNKIIKKEKIENGPSDFKKSGMSAETKLWIITFILVFIALNVWGYYFYKKGFFGISADITTPITTPNPVQNPDSIYMIPGI